MRLVFCLTLKVKWNLTNYWCVRPTREVCCVGMDVGPHAGLVGHWPGGLPGCGLLLAGSAQRSDRRGLARVEWHGHLLVEVDSELAPPGQSKAAESASAQAAERKPMRPKPPLGTHAARALLSGPVGTPEQAGLGLW